MQNISGGKFFTFDNHGYVATSLKKAMYMVDHLKELEI